MGAVPSPFGRRGEGVETSLDFYHQKQTKTHLLEMNNCVSVQLDDTEKIHMTCRQHTEISQKSRQAKHHFKHKQKIGNTKGGETSTETQHIELREPC